MLFIIDSCGWIEYITDGKFADEFAKYIEKVPNDKIVSTKILELRNKLNI